MSSRRNHKAQNGEMPLSAGQGDVPVPEGRIEMGTPPEIDVTGDQVGRLFTERRHALGLRIEEIAEDIKVKPEFLRAIEREEFDQLPTPQYARLFVRAYAERLGFNTAEMYALIDVNVPSLSAVASLKPAPVASSKDPQIPAPAASAPIAAPEASRGMSRKSMLWWGLGLTAIMLMIIGWAVLNRASHQEESSPAVTQQTELQEAAPTVTAEEVPPASDVGVAIVPDTGRFEIVLQFGQDTWTLLAADGAVVENRIFSAGEQLTASANDEFRLSLGHTAGVTASFGGKQLRPFSEWAARLEAYVITRDSVEAWLDFAAAAGAAPAEVVPGPSVEDSAGAP